MQMEYGNNVGLARHDVYARTMCVNDDCDNQLLVVETVIKTEEDESTYKVCNSSKEELVKHGHLPMIDPYVVNALCARCSHN